MVKISSENETLNLQSEKYIVPSVINKIYDPKTQEFVLENYQMYPCSNFMNMSSIKVVDELSSSHDMEYLCMRDEDHWKLELDHVRSRIFVVLDTCATVTAKYDFMAYKGQCASDAEMDASLREFEVKVVFKNQLFTMQNYEASHTTDEMYEKDLTAFWTGPTQIMDIGRNVRDKYTLKQHTVTMDDNWLLQSILWKSHKTIHFYNPNYLDQDTRFGNRIIKEDVNDPGKTSRYTVELLRDPRIEN